MKNTVRSILLLAIAFLSLASCRSSKDSLSYFDNIRNSSQGTLGNVNYELRIVPDDELSIFVTSVNPSATVVYNLPAGYTPIIDPVSGLVNYHPSGGPRTYQVTAAGDITFPVLGKIHVAGMTTDELAEMLYEKISKDVEDPIVTVNLANFHVNVLGEVNRPGVVVGSGERFSVLDAVSRAGDLTQYAVRDNVLLIRENNGTKEYHHLNLNDSSLFTSPYFYMQQNDILIVDPNDVRRSNAKYDVNNAYKIQVTSAIISGCSVIASLVIALAIK